MTPYYADDSVTLYHGDCLEITKWLTADVLVTDPPYGIAWKQDLSGYAARGYQASDIPDHPGIKSDGDVSVRDSVLRLWGHRPALMFGSPRVAPPSGAIHALAWRKPDDAGLIGSWLPWRRDLEHIYVIGRWPQSRNKVSSLIDGPRGMASYIGTGSQRHPHTKPISVMEALIERIPSGVVADPFAGSGATLIAARNQGRQAIGVEIEERYCEIIAKRLAQGVLL